MVITRFLTDLPESLITFRRPSLLTLEGRTPLLHRLDAERRYLLLLACFLDAWLAGQAAQVI